MKKVFAIILCVTVLFGCAGCTDIVDSLVNEYLYAQGDAEKYNAIFQEANVDHTSPVSGDKVASYAMKDENGNILCVDYVYNNDVVSAWAETTYVPITGWTNDMLIQLRQNLQVELMYLDLIECCTVAYEQTEEYYIVTCIFNDVDEEENYSALYRAEISDQESAISMLATEDQLMADGYIKK